MTRLGWNFGRFPAAAVAAGLLLAAPDALAKDVRTIHQQFVYYDVSGMTIPDILRDIHAKKPAAALGYTSLTTFFYEWGYNFSTGTDAAGAPNCGIFNATVLVDIDVTMPRHPTIAEAPQDVQDAWNKFITATERHELHHAADFAEIGFGIPAAFSAITAPDCDAAKKAADAVGKEFLRRAEKAGLDYDVETNHGVNDGAILQ